MDHSDKHFPTSPYEESLFADPELSLTGIKDLSGVPDGVSSLGIFDSPDLISLEGLPATVTKLGLLQNPGLTSLQGLSNSVTHLHVFDCAGLTSLAGIPDSVTHLNIFSCTSFRDLSILPPRLVSLLVMDCMEEIVALAELPATLTDLYMTQCPQFASAKLPAGLKILQVSCYEKKGSLPRLPKGLRSLAIIASSVSFPTLPEGLVSLALDTCCNVEMPLFGGVLPDSLEKLWVNGCPLIRSLPSVPRNLRLLSANRYLTQDLPELGLAVRIRELT